MSNHDTHLRDDVGTEKDDDNDPVCCACTAERLLHAEQNDVHETWENIVGCDSYKTQHEISVPETEEEVAAREYRQQQQRAMTSLDNQYRWKQAGKYAVR